MHSPAPLLACFRCLRVQRRSASDVDSLAALSVRLRAENRDLKRQLAAATRTAAQSHATIQSSIDARSAGTQTSESFLQHEGEMKQQAADMQRRLDRYVQTPTHAHTRTATHTRTYMYSSNSPVTFTLESVCFCFAAFFSSLAFHGLLRYHHPG